MKPSLVSIIIPTCNRAALLFDAIESCLNQTYKNIEIIVIDDDSTDNTEFFMNQMLNTTWKDKLIIYHKQNKAGASAARNKGIELSCGDYIQFLDSDDLLLPEKLQLQIEQLQKAQVSELCSCYGILGTSINHHSSKRIGIKCQSPLEYLLELNSKVVHGMQTSAPLWESLFLKSQKGWCESISLGDDLEYHIRLLTKIKQVSFVNKELFFVREHEGERLSVVQHDKNKMNSHILTKQIIHQTLIDNNMWNRDMQSIFLTSVTGIYANVLKCGTKKERANFESWMLNISTKPQNQYFYIVLIYFRKIFGRYILLLLHRITLFLKKYAHIYN